MYSLLGWCQQQWEEAEAGGGGCTAMALGTSHAARLSLCAARCLHSAYRLPLPHFLCKVRYPDCLSAPVCCALGRGAPEPGPVARTAPQGGLWAGGEARQVRFALRAARCCSVRGAHSHCCMHKPAAVAPVAADSFVACGKTSVAGQPTWCRLRQYRSALSLLNQLLKEDADQPDVWSQVSNGPGCSQAGMAGHVQACHMPCILQLKLRVQCG